MARNTKSATVSRKRRAKPGTTPARTAKRRDTPMAVPGKVTAGDSPSRKTAPRQPEPKGRLTTADGLEVSATAAQNNFGVLMDQAARDVPVFIKRRNIRRAVLVSIERY